MIEKLLRFWERIVWQWIKLRSLPKTLLVNFYYFPFSTAIKLPILIGYNVKINRLGSRNAITLNEIRRSVIKFGIISGSFQTEFRSGYWDIGENGTVTFSGDAVFAKGSCLIVDGNLHIGKHFYSNSNFLLNASSDIKIGDHCIAGWNVTLIDGDGHPTNRNDMVFSGIVIEDHVWLCSEAMILKNSYVAKDFIVGARACVSKKFQEPACLIAGVPAAIVRYNVSWNV